VDAKEEPMNEKQPWQPKVPEDEVFNPFAPATQNSQPDGSVEIPDLDETDGEDSDEAPAKATPAKVPPASR
jgi:hypothetical protein